MFSDKFTEINNYSLFQKEYIDTSSIMPWRYTSIFDEEYKPDLSQEIKNKLQLFYYYRLQYTITLLEDDKKYIEILHNDTNQIKEFRAINPIQLIVFKDPSEWNHFIHTIESSNLDPCKQKIRGFVKDYEITTQISSITFDENCDATGMYFWYTSPDPINDSELITKLHTTSQLISNCGVSIHITPNTNCLRYRIIPNYYLRSFGFRKITKKPLFDSSNVVFQSVNYQKHTENCINVFLEQNIITSEMADYIKKVMPENTKMELEYLINSSGELDDIIFRNTVIEEFETVSDQQKQPIFDTMAASHIWA